MPPKAPMEATPIVLPVYMYTFRKYAACPASIASSVDLSSCSYPYSLSRRDHSLSEASRLVSTRDRAPLPADRLRNLSSSSGSAYAVCLLWRRLSRSLLLSSMEKCRTCIAKGFSSFQALCPTNRSELTDLFPEYACLNKGNCNAVATPKHRKDPRALGVLNRPKCFPWPRNSARSLVPRKLRVVLTCLLSNFEEANDKQTFLFWLRKPARA